MPRPALRPLSLITLTTITVAGLLWFGGDREEGATVTTATDEATQRPPPESWSRGLRTTQYTNTGQRHYILEAAWQIQENEDRISVTTPVIRLFDEEQLRWQVRSTSGTIRSNVEYPAGVHQLELAGDVRVDYTDDSQGDLVLTTQRMTVYPEDEILYSDMAVEVLGPGFHQTSSGMRATLQQEQLDFFGRVQGQFHEQ